MSNKENYYLQDSTNHITNRNHLPTEQPTNINSNFNFQPASRDQTLLSKPLSLNHMANMENEKLLETFMMFQNFMEMVNKPKMNSNNPNNPNMEVTQRLCLKNDEVTHSINQEDMMPKLIEKMKQENNAYEQDLNFERKERKSSARSDRGVSSNHVLEEIKDDDGDIMKTNDLKNQKNLFRQIQNSDKSPVKNMSSSAVITGVNNIKNYDEIPIKTSNSNFIELFEKNLEIAKYDLVEENHKSDVKLKKVVLRKNSDNNKQTDNKKYIQSEYVRNRSPNEKNLNSSKKEDKQQIKKITTKFILKKNISVGNNRRSNEKITEDKKIELPFKNNEKIETEIPSEYKLNPYVRKINNAIESNDESYKVSGKYFKKSDEARDARPKTPKTPEVIVENYYTNEENRAITPKNKIALTQDIQYKADALNLGYKHNGDNKTKTEGQTENITIKEEKSPEMNENKQTQPVNQNKKEINDELYEEVVEEVEEEEDECEMVVYDDPNEETSKKSNNEADNSNLDQSNQLDNPLMVDLSVSHEYKDFFSSRVIEINNELIKLKGENEKVQKMKSEYQKLTRKLKLEIEEFNERRDRELKRLKLESEEFEEKKERELKKFKLDFEEFYERKERELREIEEIREEEMKKIQREKKLVERNMKLNLSLGNKKDKDEIDSLKTHLNKVIEDQKFKDNTNKLLIDRLRKQLDDANAKVLQLNKTIDELRSLQLINKKRINVSSSSVKINNRTKSETKTNSTLKKTSSVKELSTKVKENKEKDSKLIKKNVIPVEPNYKTESVTKRSNIKLVDEIQSDHNVPSYELVFLEKYHPKSSPLTKVLKTDKTNDGKVIKVYEDGRREVIFQSGVRKEIHTDGYQIVYFTNKDIKQTFPDGKSVYYFSEAKTTQTNLPNGLQVFKFENGQIEKHHPDGSKQITFPDGTLKCILEDGYEETLFPDGSIQKIDKKGVTTVEHEDGIKEIKYPDGREVVEYPEGHEITLANSKIKKE